MSPLDSPDHHRQRLFDLDMRLSILRTKLCEAERERNMRAKRRQPTRMVETIIEIIAGDIARMSAHRDELVSALDDTPPV